LLLRGYDFVYFDGLNRFYVAHDHPELCPSLALPPNIFDNFAQAERLDELAAMKNSMSWRLAAPLRESKRSLQALQNNLRSVGAGLARQFRVWSTGSSNPAGIGKLPQHAGGLARSV